MRKQAVLIVGAIVAVLAVFGVVVTPDQYDTLLALVLAVIPIAGALYAKSQVASKDTVEKELGKPAEEKVFRNNR